MIISTLIHKYIMMTEHHTQKSQRNNKNMNIMDAENDKFSVRVYDKLYSVSGLGEQPTETLWYVPISVTLLGFQ